MAVPRVACLLMGGPTRAIIDARGKPWLFEDHPQLGPVVLKPNQDPVDPQPGEGSLFWPAWSAWRDQGKVVRGEFGAKKIPLCQWSKPE